MKKTKNNSKRTLGILLFHGFYMQEDRHKNKYHPYVYISNKVFDEIIEYYCDNGVRFIGPESIQDIGNEDFDGINCLITFDDGYYNNFFVLDVLEKYNIKVLLYPVKEQIVRQQSFWWEVFYNKQITHMPFEAVYEDIQNLKLYKYNHIISILSDRFGKEGFLELSDYNRPMTLEELKKIKEHPLIELGAHSTAHERLTNLSDKEIENEIGRSKEFLEGITGHEIKHMSYPFGFFNDNIIHIAEKMGFETSVTSIPGINYLLLDSKKYDWLKLFRNCIPIPKVMNKSTLRQAKDILNGWKKEIDSNPDI